MNDRTEWAQRYIGYGWTLLPITPREKKPFFAVLNELYDCPRVGHLHDAPAILDDGGHGAFGPVLNAEVIVGGLLLPEDLAAGGVETG